jgi:L,D-transpeptidase catalytic domain
MVEPMLVALLLAALAAAEPEDPCPGRATSVVVDVKARTLWLCEGGASVESFRVATGWSGTPKKMEGDGKTPIGVYPLGAPQESDDWFWLIPVDPREAAGRGRDPLTRGYRSNSSRATAGLTRSAISRVMAFARAISP